MSDGVTDAGRVEWKPPFGYILSVYHSTPSLAAWWRPDGNGYTTVLDEAGYYTEEDARRRTSRDVWVPVPMARERAFGMVSRDDGDELDRICRTVAPRRTEA